MSVEGVEGGKIWQSPADDCNISYLHIPTDRFAYNFSKLWKQKEIVNIVADK